MKRFVHHLVLVYVVALIAVVGSERMFWYWSDTPLEHLEGAVFYAVCTAAFLAVLRRFEVHSWWGVILSIPIFAYVTEGVITPVLYSGGPTPFFPLWFTGWHGVLSMLVLFIVVRAWAIERRTWAIAGLAVGLGAFWGTWLITSRLPAQLEDPDLVEQHGVLVPLEPGEFALYAATFTAFVLGAHLLLNRVWPSDPGRLFARSERLLAAGLLAGAALWTVAAPWALPMFVGLCWVQFRILGRHRDRRPPGRPTVLESLGADASARSLLPLARKAPVAAAVYQLWWELDPAEAVLNTIYFGTVGVQTVLATVLLVLAWRRSSGHASTGGRGEGLPGDAGRVTSAGWPEPDRSALVG